MKEKEITINDLARMVGHGFEGLEKKINDGFKEANAGLNAFKKETRKEFDKMENRLDSLEAGHEKINLKLNSMEERLDNLSIERSEFNGLEKRVEKCELKLGLTKS